jgi:hypothetical protein
MRQMLVGVIVALSAAGQATGQADRKPPTKEQLERRKQVDDLQSTANATLQTIDDISRKRLTACIMAFGHEGFCNCLNKKLSIYLDFEAYIRVVTRSKADLGYDKLPTDGQKLVDGAVKARETCVATVWAP